MNVFTKIAVLAVVLFSCQNDQLQRSHYDTVLAQTMEQVSPTNELSSFILPEDGDYSQFVQEPQNPMTSIKVELGKLSLIHI